MVFGIVTLINSENNQFVSVNVGFNVLGIGLIGMLKVTLKCLKIIT